MSLDGILPQDESRWLIVADDERYKVQIEFWRGLPFMHAEFRQPLAAMRIAHDVFRQIKAWLKSMGHYEVFVAIPEGNAMLERFERRFGFAEYKRIKGHIIMFQRV